MSSKVLSGLLPKLAALPLRAAAKPLVQITRTTLSTEQKAQLTNLAKQSSGSGLSNHKILVGKVAAASQVVKRAPPPPPSQAKPQAAAPSAPPALPPKPSAASYSAFLASVQKMAQGKPFTLESLNASLPRSLPSLFSRAGATLRQAVTILQPQESAASKAEREATIAFAKGIVETRKAAHRRFKGEAAGHLDATRRAPEKLPAEAPRIKQPFYHAGVSVAALTRIDYLQRVANKMLLAPIAEDPTSKAKAPIPFHRSKTEVPKSLNAFHKIAVVDHSADDDKAYADMMSGKISYAEYEALTQ